MKKTDFKNYYINDVHSMEFIENLIDVSNRNSSFGRVFDDFCQMTVASFHQDEDSYQSIIKKYKKEDVNILAKSLGSLVLAMDDNGNGKKDVLGEIFQIGVTRGERGQFFTPMHICNFMAQIAISDDTPKNYTIADPCCGAGRFSLAAATLNPFLIHYNADLDYRCVNMTVINMVLNGIRGEVAWMNSLSMEFYHSFWIWPNGIGIYPIIEKNTEQSKSRIASPEIFLQQKQKVVDKIIQQKPDIKQDEIEKVITQISQEQQKVFSGEQLSLDF